MFRKIVSSLPFSPALVGQLGFYAKRLRSEETTRKIGLVFVVLTLIVQSLAVFQPAESANASSQNDMVTGGLESSITNFLTPYDANNKNLKDIMNFAGITRQEITATKYTSWTNNETLYWGLAPHFSYDQGERQYNIAKINGEQTITIYLSPSKLWSNKENKVWGWVGHSSNIGWFAIMQSNGNLVTTTTPKPVTTSINSQSSFKCTLSALCPDSIVRSETVTNVSKNGADASTVIADAGDQINYTVEIKNTGYNLVSTNLSDNLSDILEYSTLIDNGGGTLNESTKILSWPDINLGKNDIQTRTFIIRLDDTIPATAQGASDTTSYDCTMSNTFGNSTNIKVNCPAPKVIEQVTSDLPRFGLIGNIVFASVILIITAYFYARTRQLEKEIRIIRRTVSVGTI
jgi:uncharacterized repeat protein (TIGR01451 family)